LMKAQPNAFPVRKLIGTYRKLYCLAKPSLFSIVATFARVKSVGKLRITTEVRRSSATGLGGLVLRAGKGKGTPQPIG